jgi:Bacterial Ig domain
MSQGLRTYDQEYINALRHIADIVPQNETLIAAEIYPQVTYFTDHQVKAPWVRSERALVQFMWKNNSTYLFVPEYTTAPQPDNTPLPIQLARKPFEKMSELYAQYISVPKPKSDNSPTPLLNTSSVPQLDNNTQLNIRRSIEENVVFPRLFEKILDYPTENSLLHLYKLRSNLTHDNLVMGTDITRPMLSVSDPINGTIMESEFDVLRVNVTGSANDADSNIKKVEISIGGSPYQLADPRTLNDWSTWSFSDVVTAGTQRIVVRATDNAENRVWVPIQVTIK